MFYWLIFPCLRSFNLFGEYFSLHWFKLPFTYKIVPSKSQITILIFLIDPTLSNHKAIDYSVFSPVTSELIMKNCLKTDSMTNPLEISRLDSGILVLILIHSIIFISIFKCEDRFVKKKGVKKTCKIRDSESFFSSVMKSLKFQDN